MNSKLIVLVLSVFGALVASCESHRLKITIKNSTADTIRVNYRCLKSNDPLYLNGYPFPAIKPHYLTGRIDENYDSVTEIHSFSIAPYKTCILYNSMNEDLSRLDNFVLCKQLEIIRDFDTLVSAYNKGTTSAFEKIDKGISGVDFELVVDK